MEGIRKGYFFGQRWYVKKRGLTLGWALSAPREVERSIGIRQLSYSTLVVVLSSRSLYSKFFFLHTREHEQNGRVHCVEASAKSKPHPPK